MKWCLLLFMEMRGEVQKVNIPLNEALKSSQNDLLYADSIDCH